MALEDYRNDLMRCVRCSVCKYIPLNSIFKSARFSVGCPSFNKYRFHSYSGGGKLITALSLIEGRIENSDKLRDVVYKCTLCGLCDTSCKCGMDLEPLEVMYELRARMVEQGWGPMGAHKPILDSVRNYDNVWMQPRSRRDHWSRKLAIKNLTKEQAEYLYFAGCTYSFDHVLSDVARSTAVLLQRGGLDLGILGSEERCCGSPIFMVGDHGFFRELAHRNIERFNSLGVKKVITSCAGCYGILKTQYPRVGIPMNFEVVHSVEVLADLIRQGALRPEREVDLTVTYHDPCHLGRLSEPREASHGREETVLNILPVKSISKIQGFNGVYDPPREILQAIPGVVFREMERVREYSWCCGSGAGVKSAFPEFALETAAERLEEATSTGAQALVTCCPWCERNLMDAVEETGSPMKVLDLTHLLLTSL